MTLTAADIKTAFDIVFHWTGVWTVMVGGTLAVGYGVERVRRWRARGRKSRRYPARRVEVVAGKPYEHQHTADRPST